MSIKIHIYLILMLAYVYAIGKLELFLYYYAFVIMHEIAHIIIALLLKVDVNEITLLPIGVNANYSEKISFIKELIISLAGPLASFLFAILLKKEEFIIMNLCICLFNLIPIYPLDGGKVIRSFFSLICGNEAGKKINHAVSKFFIIILALTAIILIAYFKNYYMGILVIYIFSISIEEFKKEKFYGLVENIQSFIQ